MSWLHKRPEELRNEILFSRTGGARSFLLVEGEDDSRFWNPRRHHHCRVVDCGGKTTTLTVVADMERRAIQGVLGIVDDDMESLCAAPPTSPNVIVTDGRDLEAMLLRGRALEHLLAELADSGRVERLERQEGRSVRDALIARALPFGQIHRLARHLGCTPDFDHALPVRAFFAEGSWALDLHSLHAKASDLGLAQSPMELRVRLDALSAADPWRVCRGHDLIWILDVGLKTELGSLRPSELGETKIARALRLAAREADIHATTTWTAIRDWEAANTPYRIVA